MQRTSLPRTSAPLRILVVDDNTDAGEALAQILQDDGNEVRMAFQGEAALEVAAVFHPNLILLDIGLPGMDGHEVARRLRANRVDAMLVAVTGYGQKADRDAAAAAGFDEHIVKPVELEKLARVIARAQAAAKAPTPWTLPPDPFDSRPN